MIRINQVKLKYNHTPADLKKKIEKMLHISDKDLVSYQIYKQSIDARKKPDIYFVYSVDVNVANEAAILKRARGAAAISPKPYQFSLSGDIVLQKRPVIIGSGPAGLFCGYLLAKHGFRPILLERGAPVEERAADVEKFWESGILNPDSNVQFGEGGAGTFSDGKLNTLVKDPIGRNRFVLETFVSHGAPESILYESKPHIGTDILRDVVKNMRSQIIRDGGEVHFHRQVTDFEFEQDKKLTGLVINNSKLLKTDVAVLAIGHSARDTFAALYNRAVPMTAKSFAVGVRVEHPQSMINQSQYGAQNLPGLSPASYKLTAQTKEGRGVYSFCMCPGGYVVNASSEAGMLAVNGMSYHGRAGENANSAIIVTVTPDDYESEHPLAGIAFQRELERKAFLAGNGVVPLQRFEDFCAGRATTELGSVRPAIKGTYSLTDIRPIFPESLAISLEEGIRMFDRKISGFAGADTLLSGVESRTSSPVKILRDDSFESPVAGLYPCGEGAGFAGGITSAAMDGIKVAEAIAARWKP